MFSLSSFAVTPALRSVGNSRVAADIISPASTSTTTLLPMVFFRQKVIESGLSNYAGVASSFFTSIRVPAALIAGSSLAAFFTLADRVNHESELSSLERIALRAYHSFAFLALLLSLNVVIVATATANFLLLGSADPMATSAYEFMNRECEFEFLLTRWSFFVSLFSLLGCIGTRALIEFRLLCRKRLRSALLVVSSISGMLFHLVSFVNRRVTWRNNMGTMTVHLVQLFFQFSLSGNSVLGAASVVCLGLTAALGISVLWSPISYDETDDRQLLADENKMD